MAEINTSIYNIPQNNALSQFGQMASGMNAMMQNRIMQEQFRTNMATGDAYRQALDPNTGQIDPRKLAMGVANSPAAYNLPQVMQQVQQQRQAAVGLETSEYELANKRLGTMRSTLGSLLANPNVSGKDVIAASTGLVSQGLATPKMVADAIATMPSDPKGLKVWLTDHMVNTMGAQEKLNAAYGTPQMQAGVDAQGRPMQMPISVSPITGVNQLPVNAGNAQMPGAPGMPQGGGVPVAQNAQGAQGIITGLAPGEQAAMDKSAAAFSALQDRVGGSAQRVFQLNQALTGLQGANTGPGTEFRNTLQSYILALPGGVGQSMVDEKGVVNYDKAMKYLMQNATAAAGAMGSDAKLASALSGNASTKISNLAAQDVVKASMALERVEQAQADVFARSGALPGEFSKWAVQWNKNVDPRAFALDMMDVKDRAKLIGELKGAERQKFIDSVKLAIGTGVIDPQSFQTQVAAKK